MPCGGLVFLGTGLRVCVCALVGLPADVESIKRLLSAGWFTVESHRPSVRSVFASSTVSS